jgi:transcriptional regulator with XRE-family HTH domain
MESISSVLNTRYGAFTTPNPVPLVRYPNCVPKPARIDAAQALAEAVQNLLDYAADHGRPCSNLKALGKKAGIGASTIRRILDKTVSPSIDKVDAIAKAYGLQAYQLLIPDWKPSNPPVVPYTATEKALYRAVDTIAKELALPGGTDDDDEGPASNLASARPAQRVVKARQPSRKRRPVTKI